MNHLTDEELVLHYYGDGDNRVTVERHCGECEACRALYLSIERTLQDMDALSVPERGAAYGAEVWERIQSSMPARTRLRLPSRAWRWAAAGLAFAAMLVLAFLAGRFYPAERRPALIAADSALQDRVLLIAVGDYLARSQIVLTELANARPNGPLDISFEQARAADLLDENRLYRQTALRTGDVVVAGVLDELERVLLEIAHGPSRISANELNDLHLRLQAEGILFKIRVLGSNVRSQSEPATRQPL